jgi:hypothetical protein
VLGLYKKPIQARKGGIAVHSSFRQIKPQFFIVWTDAIRPYNKQLLTQPYPIVMVSQPLRA